MIYPAAALAQARGHAQYASTRVAGRHFVEAVRDGGRQVIGVWQDGACTWTPGTDD
jgi:hypothetical protein